MATGRATARRAADAVGRRGRLLPILSVAAGLLAPASAGAAGPPAVGAEWTTGVTTTSAVLRAEIDPEGLSTRYHFEYLTLAASEANLDEGREAFAGAAKAPAPDAAIGSGSAPIPVSFTLSAPVNPLAPGTPYRYRAVATNAAGADTGPARSLRTRSTAPPGLLDGRGWELVSPLDKGGGAVAGPGALFGGGEIQAAAGGGGLTYGSATAFASPQGAPPVSQYLSTRGPGGWSTAALSPPLESGGYGDQPDGAPFRLFSLDLGRALMLNGERCAVEETCPPSYSLWSAGAFQALPSDPGLRFEGATPDLQHIVFGAEGGLYEWSGGPLEEISPVGGATLAAPIGALSEDGSRLYFTVPEDGPTYLYETGAGARPVPKTVGGAVAFEAASADGALAYFTRAGELYRYSAAAESSTPIASGVVGVLAVSPDGSRVYYQDGSGLRLWHEGTVRQIAPGADAALPSDYPPATATARLAAAGTVLAFLSAAPIGESDNRDADTGSPDTELYLYDAGADSLLCASCNPTGERPGGSASIPGALVNGTTTAYRPRVLSADGRRLFFDSADALVSSDTDSATDVYEWEAPGEGSCTEAPGCVALVSGGRGEGGRFLDAAADGADAFFLTGDSLVGADPGSIDAYDARVGGGFPEPTAPIPCNGDACQPLPSPPEDPPAGTSIQGPANPPPHYAKEAPGRGRCPKGKVRRHGRCVKAHHRHPRGGRR